MGYALTKSEQTWSYADYLQWPDDERWELIDGVAYAMSPSPSRQHQELSGEFFRQFANYLKGKPCKVYDAPFDVRLSEQKAVNDNYITTVVQPDILVVCDTAKLDDRGCNGAPDLIIEILSPATASRDLKEKFDLYQRFGVKEYWIVQPVDKTLMFFTLQENGCYCVPGRYAGNDKVAVPLLGELCIDLQEVFAE